MKITSRLATLFAALLLWSLSADRPARAGVADDLWNCASTAVSAAGKCLATTAEVGGKVLSFVANPSNAICIGKMGSSVPDTLIMGTTVALANANVLPRDKSGCSSAILSTAAEPMGSALQQVPVLKGVGNQLVAIGKGEASAAAAANIPFLDSFDCGCRLVDAGLSVDTVKRVVGMLHEVDKVGSACGGAVWDAAKNILRGLYTFDGDAIVEGIAGLGTWLNNTLESPFQSPHIPVDVYWARYWVPRIDEVALGIHQGRDIWTPVVSPTWHTCKNYFDSHRMSGDHAQGVCDDMRDGNNPPQRDGRFINKGFEDRVQRRIFEMHLLPVVQAAASNAIARFSGEMAQMAPGVPAQYFSQADVIAAVDDVYGTYEGQVLATPEQMVPFPFGSVAEKLVSNYPQFPMLLNRVNGLVIPQASIQAAFDQVNAVSNPNDQQVRDTLLLRAGVARARWAKQQAVDKLLAQNEWFDRDVVKLNLNLNYAKCDGIANLKSRVQCAAAVGELVRSCQADQFEAYYAKQQSRPPQIRIPGGKPPPGKTVAMSSPGQQFSGITVAQVPQSMPPNVVNVISAFCSAGVDQLVQQYRSGQPKMLGKPQFSVTSLRQSIANAPLRKLKFSDQVFTDPDAMPRNAEDLGRALDTPPPPATATGREPSNPCAQISDPRRRMQCQQGNGRR